VRYSVTPKFVVFAVRCGRLLGREQGRASFFLWWSLRFRSQTLQYRKADGWNRIMTYEEALREFSSPA